MPGRKRPSTGWINHCSDRVRETSPHLSKDAARKICAANWWHRMSDEAKARAASRYEPPPLELFAPEPPRRTVKTSSKAVRARKTARVSHGFPRLPAGANHQHGPGPRRCPKCGV